MAFCKKWSTMSGLVTCKKNYFKVYLMEIRNFMCWILNFCVNSEEAIGNSEALIMQPNVSSWYKHKHSSWTKKIICCIGTLHDQLLTAAKDGSHKRLSIQLFKVRIRYVLMEL
jgi:hypothetical protein